MSWTRPSRSARSPTPPWLRFELRDLRVIEATPDTAVVTYRATAQRSEDKVYEALMTTGYARREGRWRMVLHQQTPTPAG